MKCTNFVAYEVYGKKGKTRRVAMRPDWVVQTQKYKQFAAPPEPCTGTLKILLEVKSGCCCGEDPTELSVNFTCSECGPIEFDPQSLPNQYDLVEWINALMDNTASLSFCDTTTKGNILRSIRNGAMAVLEAQGMSSTAARSEVLRREMSEAKDALDLTHRKTKS